MHANNVDPTSAVLQIQISLSCPCRVAVSETISVPPLTPDCAWFNTCSFTGNHHGVIYPRENWFGWRTLHCLRSLATIAIWMGVLRISNNALQPDSFDLLFGNWYLTDLSHFVWQSGQAGWLGHFKAQRRSCQHLRLQGSLLLQVLGSVSTSLK